MSWAVDLPWRLDNAQFEQLAGDAEMSISRRWIIQEFAEKWKNTEKLEIDRLVLDFGRAIFNVVLKRSSTGEGCRA